MKIIIRQPLCFSEIGRKDNQEDCIYPSAKDVNAQNRFFILCDGMGGHENGEVASATVCEALGKYFNSNIPEDGVMTPDLFKQALEYAYNELDKKDTGGLKKMGTTMTCLYLHKKGYLVAHIGDSRIYHIRPNTGIVYQSSDHSLVNDLLRAGELTEEEALNFPQKNVITRVMQPNLERRHKADVFSFSDIKKGDYFFLCCDGVLEQLTNDCLCEILSDKKLNDSQKLDAIKQVCDGKTKDNYTCYLIPVDDVVMEEDDKVHSQDDLILGVELADINSPVEEKLPINRSRKGNKLKWSILFISLLVVGCGIGILCIDNDEQCTKEDICIPEKPVIENIRNVLKEDTIIVEESLNKAKEEIIINEM